MELKRSEEEYYPCDDKKKVDHIDILCMYDRQRTGHPFRPIAQHRYSSILQIRPFYGMERVILNHRQQWSSVQSPYVTTNGSFELNIGKPENTTRLILEQALTSTVM